MKNSKNLILILFFALVFSIPGFSQSKFSSERLDRYDEFFQSEIEKGKLPGIVTLIYKDGEKVHESALGYSDIAGKKPMRTDQIFYIQSMTKPIVTTAFMMLYEEGHFFLTDPVSKYLPEFKE